MRLDRFTIKSQELIQGAQSLASKNGNQQIEPEHLGGGDALRPEGIAGSMLASWGPRPRRLRPTS
jgi:ATP-dependent Clp protease ATP-binding subunit ClpB